MDAEVIIMKFGIFSNNNPVLWDFRVAGENFQLLFFATSFFSWRWNLAGFFSRVRWARVLIFIRSFVPVRGSTIVLLETLGLNLRLVLRSEWLTLQPTCGPFPDSWQTLDIMFE